MDHTASTDPNSSGSQEFDDQDDKDSLEEEQLRSEKENETSLSEHFGIVSPRKELQVQPKEDLAKQEASNVPVLENVSTPSKPDPLLVEAIDSSDVLVDVGANQIEHSHNTDTREQSETTEENENLAAHQNDEILLDLSSDLLARTECAVDFHSDETAESQETNTVEAQEIEPTSQTEKHKEPRDNENVEPIEEKPIECKETETLESKNAEPMIVQVTEVKPVESGKNELVVPEAETEAQEVQTEELNQIEPPKSHETQSGILVDVDPPSPTFSSQRPSSASPATRTAATPPSDMLHHIKNIHFKDKKVGIVTQNENGPCPLVAILNVLLLRRQITLPNHLEIVAASKLMEYIGHAMLENVPKNLSGEVRLNYEQNMHDAMAVLPKLQTGLDVNVKFTGVRDFEYTPECIIFDLLGIPLFHGWLVDPQTPEVVAAVGQAGYNQLVEKVITQKCSNDQDALIEALVIENFLERSASQLTYHGLSELTASMNDDEIGVLFRNNHFSTIYKHQKELLQLVTDQGFLGESNVVWETLGSIDGDGQFVDSQFRTVPPKPDHSLNTSSTSPNTSAQLTAEQQIDHDFLVALSLQEEHEQPTGLQDEMVAEDVAKTLSDNEKTTQELMDLELARQLQQEEERQAAEAETAEREAAAAAASSQQQPAAAGSRSPPQPSKKKENCTIL